MMILSGLATAPVEPGCWAGGLLDSGSEEPPQAVIVSAATTAVATPANVRFIKGLLTN
jgi:hypothetical protein